jgi:hypothetical protein
MSLDTILDSLSDEAASAVRAVLKKAYERGYREGLASHGPARTTASEEPSAQPNVTAVAFRDETEEPVEDDPPGDDEAEEPTTPAVAWDREAQETDVQRPAGELVRPILARTTVGTLKERIIKVFGLDRFDIDIVICRRGDRERRQLKTNVRLSRYMVGE